MNEKSIEPMSGWPALIVCLVAILFSIFSFILVGGGGFIYVPISLLMLAGIIGLIGLMPIQPNEARVLTLFGNYIGSARESGFFWVNPFYSSRKVSLRIRNFETGSQVVPEKVQEGAVIRTLKTRTAGKPSKVNDQDGNPIEISAVVVWRVVNTAEATFEVDDYENFVSIQSESALRTLASRHPYDREGDESSLRGNTDSISKELQRDIQDRLEKAGVEVIEARISHLAYAPEVAAAMLQRQQAQAVVAARTTIVEGAVGMVEMALERIEEQRLIKLEENERAKLVSNLLVVLCSDRHTQPVVQTGT